MQLSDRMSGVLALCLGLVVVLLTRTFPPTPGQSIGPALFPSLAGAGLIAFGAWMVVADRAASGGWLRFDDWVRRPRMVANFALVIGALVVYALVLPVVGFFLSSAVFLVTLMITFGAPPRRALPLAVVVTMAIHYVFYSLLRVPLPWGLFEAVAW
jgi:putative tricarboxylic transport membrane protein